MSHPKSQSIRNVIQLDTGIKKEKCFLISPIGGDGTDIRREADAVDKLIIRKALEIYKEKTGREMVAVRSDHKFESGQISAQILDHILRDDLIIAVIPHTNPNVFYELAVAHAAGRPVVLLVRRDYVLPFDLKDHRAPVVYDYDPISLSGGEPARQLAETILAVMSKQQKYEAPFEKKDWNPLGSPHLHFNFNPNFSDITLQDFGDVFRDAEKFIIISEPWLEVISSQPTNDNNIKWRQNDGKYVDAPLAWALENKAVKDNCRVIIMMLDTDNMAASSIQAFADSNGDANTPTDGDPEEQSPPTRSPPRIQESIPDDYKNLMADRLAAFQKLERKSERISVVGVKRGVLHSHVIMNEKGGIYFPRAYLTHAWGRAPCIKVSNYSPFFENAIAEVEFIYKQNGGTNFPSITTKVSAAQPKADQPETVKKIVRKTIIDQFCDIVAQAKQYIFLAEPDFDLLSFRHNSRLSPEEAASRRRFTQTLTLAVARGVKVRLYVMRDNAGLRNIAASKPGYLQDVHSDNYKNDYQQWFELVPASMAAEAKGTPYEGTLSFSPMAIDNDLPFRLILTETEGLVVGPLERLFDEAEPKAKTRATDPQFFEAHEKYLKILDGHYNDRQSSPPGNASAEGNRQADADRRAEG